MRPFATGTWMVAWCWRRLGLRSGLLTAMVLSYPAAYFYARLQHGINVDTATIFGGTIGVAFCAIWLTFLRIHGQRLWREKGPKALPGGLEPWFQGATERSERTERADLSPTTVSSYRARVQYNEGRIGELFQRVDHLEGKSAALSNALCAIAEVAGFDTPEPEVSTAADAPTAPVLRVIRGEAG